MTVTIGSTADTVQEHDPYELMTPVQAQFALGSLTPMPVGYKKALETIAMLHQSEHSYTITGNTLPPDYDPYSLTFTDVMPSVMYCSQARSMKEAILGLGIHIDESAWKAVKILSAMHNVFVVESFVDGSWVEKERFTNPFDPFFDVKDNLFPAPLRVTIHYQM